ncbi:hypothetical protein [Pseudozobellia thermophila]|uniref:LTXXQ motif family protein n=1 Tax=Pseudozobellia thermophila TaxID=192903 RepID=A0A1M6FIY2_9FLAO|nr:hypothetical protein [Pseudozobellia thermophila]SHI97635.1 hypothetical protein SAMN04488513_102448 [Pseudozobellia thermophila]
MNRTRTILLVAFLFATSLFHAQDKHKKDKIRSLKIAFITERLDLSSKEAQAFWPLYNKYEEDREALRRREVSEIRSKIRDTDVLSEDEAKSILKKYLSFEEKEEEIERDYLNAVSKVITAKKTLLLLRSEEEFKKHLIKQYRERRGNR